MRIPSATYRLQFHGEFTFRDATALLGYLDELGISDVYASPFFQAGSDSKHGYDVANHNTFNSAVGDESDFRTYVTELRRRGMGQILDFVPNHMGISESLNVWWMDVLENGQASAYAHYFDIDWYPGKKALEEKIVLPVLGERYGDVLEKGQLVLEYAAGAFVVRYFDTTLPVDPRTYPLILERIDGDSKEAISNILDDLRRGLAGGKAALDQVVQGNASIRAALDRALDAYRGTPGTPASFDALHELLEAQAYRLSYWRVAAEEINYRRFFDVNTLAAIRVEIPEVLEASHQFVFELLSRGDVTGLRIDHVDGLWDPKEYLGRLQSRFSELAGSPESAPGLYVVVEKILDPLREELPEDWLAAGTTGYEFANQAVHLLIDPAAEGSLTETFRRFTGVHESFAELAYQKKRLVMDSAFQSEIQRLGHDLDRLSELHRRHRDFTRPLLTMAIREVLACFPIYRTYFGDGAPREADGRAVLRAVSLARRRSPTIDKPVFDFLRNVLLLRFPDGLSEAERAAHVRFVRRFQQCSSPITAKGVEDTVLYIYNRLLALNEVGGNPGDFGLAIEDFHRLNEARRRRIPHTLLGTSTHDTKRSEDVRMRLAALTEFPEEWRRGLAKWSKANSKFRTVIGEETAPSPNEEYFLYQTLAGAWPLNADDEAIREFTGRIQEYLLKALKEAKVNSSWTEPNEEWEKAVTDFIAAILDRKTGARFLKSFLPFVSSLAQAGAWNSLSQTVLKILSPGVPDFYQGTEIWDFSLVDPDNRRPVDFARRKDLLASLAQQTPDALVENWRSGAIKLFTIRQLLRFRRERETFFRDATYRPLDVAGSRAAQVVAFARESGPETVLAVVPRLTGRLGAVPVGNVWGNTTLAVPLGRWRDLFTGEVHAAESGGLSIASVLARFPVAALTRAD